MEIPHLAQHLPTPVIVRPATPRDRTVVERLWPIFRHHMSEFSGQLPRPDGTYRSERLTTAFLDRTWRVWVVTAGGHPIGFAIVRALDQPVRVLNSFFIVAPARGSGVGRAFAEAIVRSSPGAWAVAYQDSNAVAARFWTSVAASLDTAWSLERRAVPDRPDLPPDTWVSFRAPAA